MALNGVIAVGVPQDWITHMIGHEITALHGLDHAQTLEFFESVGVKTRLEGAGRTRRGGPAAGGGDSGAQPVISCSR